MSIKFDVAAPIGAAVAATLILTAFAGEASRKPLLTQQFEARRVDQIEVGDFHFRPGQAAPVHIHAAPVFGYVSKGSIDYQVEGKAPIVLKAGDAFYEPAGPNILHFDNASTTEEAVFTDFNFEREGEPFIVFPSPPTERIDRRTFPSGRVAVTTANTMNVFEETLVPGAKLAPPAQGESVSAFVAEGAVRVKTRGEAPIVYSSGQTFYVPSGNAVDEVANPSPTATARIVTFRLSSRR